MKVKEIIKNVCVYLGKEELLESSLLEEEGVVPTNLQKNVVDKMVKCLNLITSEIASDYLPIIKEKEIIFNNGEIDALSIDENIQEIISIKNKFGKNLRYKYVNDKIICLTTNAIVTYKVYPKEVTFDDDAENFGERLSARVLAYGVASEYCYLEMLYDDASIWESRFKNALIINTRKKGEVKLKKRGWY